MDDKELRLMPEPETNTLKQALADDLKNLSLQLAGIDLLIDDMLSTQYDHTKESQQAKQRRELEITTQARQYKALARKILRDIKPYLTTLDQAQYQTKEAALEKKQGFMLNEAIEIFNYINEAAKNSNLTELGTKSILPEITDIIDADEIDNGLPATTPTPKQG